MKEHTPANSRPLVSVVVITYNSEKFIVETLDSILNQTYKNIQLVISDDGSQDQTLGLCNRWLVTNSSSFYGCKIVSAKSNSGIPANCNAGLAAAEGVWVKFLAGDDILDPEGIERFVEFVSARDGVCLVESKSRFFRGSFYPENFAHVQDLGETGFFDPSTTAEDQYQALLRRNYIHAPSVFILKAALTKVGGFDERYKLIEDHPLWLRLTKAGYRFHFLDTVSVFYRLHDSSVFASKSKGRMFNAFYKHRRAFDRDYILPNVTGLERWVYNYDYYRLFLIDKLGLNRNSRPLRLLFRLTDFRYFVSRSRQANFKNRS